MTKLATMALVVLATMSHDVILSALRPQQLRTPATKAERLSLPRITTLEHLGSFRIPEGDFGGPPYHGFSYGGYALSYNPAHNSLYMVGHRQDQLVGELQIPALDGTATVLQKLTDATGGRLDSINPGDTNAKLIGGTLLYHSRLVVSAYAYYDGSGTQVLSHFLRSPDLADATVVGPTRVGPLGAGFYSGYMGHVWDEWKDVLGGPALTGNGALSIISRTSYGPAVFAFDPDNLSPKGAQPLVYYPSEHQTLGPWGASSPYFSGADTVKGVALVKDSSTLLFFGTHGTTFCYGPGTSNQALVGKKENGQDPYCYDPIYDSKGSHGYPYVASAWAYDVNDLAAVHAGAKRPWDVVPYAAIELAGIGTQIGGATIDPVSKRLYVVELGSPGVMPKVHVYVGRP